MTNMVPMASWLLQAGLGAALIATPASSTSPPTPAPPPPSAPVGDAVTLSGPQGPLAGSYVDAGKGKPVAIIIPGSGPTDRDGNNPMGVRANSYALLATALQSGGISTLRYDKRGLFGSKAAIANVNAVTIDAYADDALGWAKLAKQKSGAPCAWLIGHSEGGLIALAAASKAPRDTCGLVLLTTPGRSMGTVLRDQLAANPANAPLLEAANGAIDALEAGKAVDVASLPAPLAPLFNPAVQPFLRDMMRYDPSVMAAATPLPILVVSGGRDLQVGAKDRDAFAAHAPALKNGTPPRRCIVTVAEMNHVLKLVPTDDRATNMATYADPGAPVIPMLMHTITRFIAADSKDAATKPCGR